MKATTNHLFCPTLKDKLPDSLVPDGVRAIYEIVIDGTSYGIVKRAIHDGIHAACSIDGIVKISAGNYGGKLGPHKFYLRVRDDMIDRARKASIRAANADLARIWHAPLQEAQNEKGQQT